MGAPAPRCPTCDHELLYRRLPLFVVAGPSGAGKSTIAAGLAAASDAPDAVFLDSDTLLIEGLSDRGWDEYRNVWVWTCINIAQSGRHVVLFGGGDPIEFARASRIHYFSSTHYMALTCDEDELRRRLIARPAWRKSAEPAFMQDMVTWNARLGTGQDTNGVTWDVVNTSVHSRRRRRGRPRAGSAGTGLATHRPRPENAVATCRAAAPRLGFPLTQIWAAPIIPMPSSNRYATVIRTGTSPGRDRRRGG